jgi:hypothetical protein
VRLPCHSFNQLLFHHNMITTSCALAMSLFQSAAAPSQSDHILLHWSEFVREFVIHVTTLACIVHLRQDLVHLHTGHTSMHTPHLGQRTCLQTQCNNSRLGSRLYTVPSHMLCEHVGAHICKHGMGNQFPINRHGSEPCQCISISAWSNSTSWRWQVGPAA